MSRFQYPTNLRIIRIPCTGRLNPQFILKSLQQGVDGVLVAGCHPGECHYTSGNLSARRKLLLIKSLLEYIGLEKDRVNFVWMSSSEGERFMKVAREVAARVKQLGPSKKLVKQW